MKRKHIIFFLTGLIAGLICVVPGSLQWWMGILTLTWGVGPLFFVAVIAGIAITGGWQSVQPGLLRYFAGLLLCTLTYLTALIVVFVVFGFSADWLGVQSSAHMNRFGIDMWLALFSAGIVGASGITIFATLLTGRWSAALLWRLVLAALITILVTFVVNLPFQTDRSFLGVLLPLGNALFCYLIGTEIWRRPEVGKQLASAREPHHPPA